MSIKYEIVDSGFKTESEIPKGKGLFYRCKGCSGLIPSVPSGSVGCECGNIFIDKDYSRLIVTDLSRLETVKAK